MHKTLVDWLTRRWALPAGAEDGVEGFWRRWNSTCRDLAFGSGLSSSLWRAMADRMFGVLTCANGHDAKDFQFALGLRGRYDRTLVVGLTSGVHITVGDNLAFCGEANANRKHTVHVFRDLPNHIYRMLAQVQFLKDHTDREIESMRVAPRNAGVWYNAVVGADARGGLCGEDSRVD